MASSALRISRKVEVVGFASASIIYTCGVTSASLRDQLIGFSPVHPERQSQRLMERQTMKVILEIVEKSRKG
ncbi:hypothetical protein RRG08_045465 [Elysia crispata]|uniref:Uncharacterized protein n=1 Tax=Elysia crispata TaxID=231223 RepID=A0AAE1AXC9_9GAST|nr:hypothetical protein RRG08_045465 [Elysia crispata]